MNAKRFTTAALLGVALTTPAWAQSAGGQTSPYFGSAPTGTATAEPLALSLKDTVGRALEHNLALMLQEESSRTSRGARLRALSDLLPHVTGSLGERRQVLNLEAFGFPAPDPIVGPFNVFDARVNLSQPLIDLQAWHDNKAAVLNQQAAVHGVRSARELVVLVSVDLYLEAIAAASRIDVARAQQATAEALLTQTQNLKTSGLVAGIDVLRAQVQVQNQRQRRLVAENDFEKAKLKLARAIGLPLGQTVTLTDTIPYSPLDAVPLDKALADAYTQRADYLAARDQLAAAEASERAATAELLPSLHFDADFGTIGQRVAGAHPTYAIGATLRVPIFEGRRTEGKRIEAGALVRQRQVEYDDLRGRIDMEVRTAALDVSAMSQQLDAVRTTVDLANQELVQARDRFAAGVAGNLEVTQAQESVASASDRYIDALFNHNLAKASLARAVGIAEQAVTTFLGGSK